MVKGYAGSERSDIGGIISLARFADEHREALEYDLLTRTRYQLDDVGGTLSWSALYSFIRHLTPDSALGRDLEKYTGWETTVKTNTILADIYDLLQVINANLCGLGSKHPTRKKIKPYPRPGKDDNNERKIGKGGLPIDKLREWIRSKQHG